MCIIIYKPAGVAFPSGMRETLLRCANKHKDGIGFAAQRKNDNKIFMKKGILSIHAVIEEILGYDENSDLVVHFRRVSAGDNSMKNTQPFTLSDNKFVRELTSYSPVLFHNGTLPSTIRDKDDKTRSDTYFFAEMLGRSLNLTTFSTENIFNIMREFLGENKFVLMKPNNAPFIFNRHLFIEDKGILYSNDSFMPEQEKKPTLPKEKIYHVEGKQIDKAKKKIQKNYKMDYAVSYKDIVGERYRALSGSDLIFKLGIPKITVFELSEVCRHYFVLKPLTGPSRKVIMVPDEIFFSEFNVVTQNPLYAHTN